MALTDWSASADTKTTIVDARYHAALYTLYITFEGAGTYTYYAVPPDVYQAFERSRNKDEFFLEYISDFYFHWKSVLKE